RIADVRRADLPSQIPALEELYRDCGSGYDLSLDVKDRAAAAEAVAVAEAAGAAGRLWLCSSGPVLARWRRLSDAVHLVDSTGWGQIREGLSARARRLRAEGVDALNLPWRDWTAARVGAVHEEGVLAFAWGAQRTALIAALCRVGVDGVYSDHVRRMQEGIRRGAARQNQCSRESGQMRTKARPTMRDRDTGPK
ncbi:MAG TPA: hypothetical protein VKV25_02910, partial [Acidimicrobiales bacterium]|nr:hypothetical protein [Acidimicrobiales bacterium]